MECIMELTAKQRRNKINIIHNVAFLTFHIFKNQQNALIKIQYNRSQNTRHIRCQLLHVSAPRCHYQGIYQQQGTVGPTHNSGMPQWQECGHVPVDG
jgi:hypothetical protein